MPRRLATAALITTVATLPACTPENPKPPPFTPTPAPTSPTTPASESEQAGVAAVAAYRRYLAVKDATAASGGRDVADLPKVATGAILGAELNQAANFRARRWRAIGQTKVLWTKPLKVGPAGGNGMITAITVQACYDSAGITAVDSTGKNVKKPGTPTRWLDEMQMHLVEGAWKAYFGMNKAVAC